MAKFKKAAAAKAPAKRSAKTAKSATKASANKTAPKSPVAALGDKAEHLSRSIMDSAQGIWLAGMGAFNRAQEEGSRLFEALVKEGSSIEQKTRKLASNRAGQVREAVENRVEQARERATDTWDKLEKIFEERVQRSLNRLGVPGHEDLAHLSRRVDALTQELKKLSAKPAVSKAESKPAAAKPAAKPAKAARKIVAKKTPKAAASSATFGVDAPAGE
jgi:poly(hydroxyalkanoate) granule-associated protein